jgi:hypothetical protein
MKTYVKPPNSFKLQVMVDQTNMMWQFCICLHVGIVLDESLYQIKDATNFDYNKKKVMLFYYFLPLEYNTR